MTHSLRLVLVFHNHQPVGNFDHVFEQAYRDSYAPFLDLLEQYPNLPIALHTSGSLMEWLAERRPEYLDRLAVLASAGRIEIVGGAFYEPILPMISSADRVGQITGYSDWLSDRFGTAINGVWIPERVWEQSLTRDIANAGIRYTLLDDFHFKNAGLAADDLHGYYVTEDETKLLSVFPGSERLRYTIPFADPQESIDYLREIANRQPNAVVVFGDDGEKFGSWPGTHEHVYTNGWLRRFFDALTDNRDWLQVTTPTEVLEQVPPRGKVYIPEGSYREMTEWALPVGRLIEFENLRQQLAQDGRWDEIAPYVRGGFWRNFKVKYPETNEMYSRMQMVSQRLQEHTSPYASNGESRNGRLGIVETLIDQARTELYRGQCNCAYWHGAFGGAYLPHLRNAVFQHLIAADNLLDEAAGRGLAEGDRPWVELTPGDYNFDGRQEVRLASNRLLALIAPAQGGMMYELDARSICHNLLATLTRREEAYHYKVRAGEGSEHVDATGIHDRVVFKQHGLDERLSYDRHPRKSLIDHFYPLDATIGAVAAGAYDEVGDFVDGTYEAKLRRAADRMQVQLFREGYADERTIRITKGVTLEAGDDTLEIAYLLEGLTPGERLHFGIEFNFAGMPAGADDRYFRDGEGNVLGQLGTMLDLVDVDALGLTDGWLGIDVDLKIDRPSCLWTFPIETVSQSEGGFELVHQSVLVQPHWFVEADAEGRWSVQIRLSIGTPAADQRRRSSERVGAGV
jgi:alpha-amylase